MSDMASGELLRVFDVLAKARVRYLVVGGVAVVLHGHLRVTADLDLVIDLERNNALAAVRAFSSLGYRPRAPVPLELFADAQQRQSWIDDKGMTVFSLWSPTSPGTEIDLFVKEPFVFDDEYSRAVTVDIAGVPVVVVALERLLVLKRAAGRPRDVEDVAALTAIVQDGTDG